METPATPTEARYWTCYADGTYAVTTAASVDEATEILARSVEMNHGPLEGEPPAEAANVDDMG
jgi:streptomycin 6-kinase